jgi:hypothetical protein
MWLTAPNLDGNRIFAVRWLADVFESLEDAEDIIAEIKNQADTTDVILSVEDDDEWPLE